MWMSYAKEKEGTTPSRTVIASQRDRSGVTMMQAHGRSSPSIPIHGSPSDVEERIDITGGSGIHVNDVLCGRGKVSFNHSK